MLYIIKIYIKKIIEYIIINLNIQSFLRKMSIKRRLIFSFLLLSFIPIIFISMFSFNNTYKDAIYKNEEFVANISYQVSNNINYLFDKYVNKFDRVSYNSIVLADVFSYIQDASYRNMEVKNRIELALASIVGKREGINSVAVYSSQGYRFNYGLSVIEEDTFFNEREERYQGAEILWDVLTDNTGEGNYILLSKKVNLRYGEDDTGFVLLSISRDYIDDVCKNNISGKHHSIIITDQDGLIISHPDRSKILKQYDKEIINRIDFYEEQRRTGVDINNVFEIEINDEDLLISYDFLRRNNWRIINVYSKSSLMKSTIENGHFLFLIALIAILISFIFLMIVTKSITLPIVNLVSKMERVGKGDVNIEIIEEDINIKDEHVILAQGFNNMTCELKTLINDVYYSKIKEEKLEFLKKEAELNSLQQQINPHFLYNTLEAIFWTAQLNGHDEIGEMVTALGNFFRTSINKGPEYITIADEMENVKNYIYIQKVRLSNFFSVEWDIQKEVKNFKTIKLILQPVIENAINHGLKNMKKNGMILIKCYKDQDRIFFQIKDNGMGIKADKVQRIQTYIDSPDKNANKSVGLKNVNQRIKLYFGDNYGLKIFSKEGQGTKIYIILPAFKNEQDIHFQKDNEEM